MLDHYKRQQQTEVLIWQNLIKTCQTSKRQSPLEVGEVFRVIIIPRSSLCIVFSIHYGTNKSHLTAEKRYSGRFVSSGALPLTPQ